MTKNCDWRARLLEKFGMSINQPAISKVMLRCGKVKCTFSFSSVSHLISSHSFFFSH